MLTVFFTVFGEFFTKAVAPVQEPLSPMLLRKGLSSKIAIGFAEKTGFARASARAKCTVSRLIENLRL
jgi:hypothetical protein